MAEHEFSQKHHDACQKVEEEHNSLTGQAKVFAKDAVSEEFAAWAMRGAAEFGIDPEELVPLYHVAQRTRKVAKTHVETHVPNLARMGGTSIERALTNGSRRKAKGSEMVS